MRIVIEINDRQAAAELVALVEETARRMGYTTSQASEPEGVKRLVLVAGEAMVPRDEATA